jgi:ribosomal protein S16
VGGQLHAPDYLPPGKEPRYQFDRRLGGPQGRSAQRGEEENLDPTELKLRPLGRPARSQSLYRLRYPGSPRHQKAGQNHNIKTADRSIENVGNFEYLGTTGTSQNLVQEEIQSRLNSGNACYHSVENILSSRLLSKNIKIGINKTIILPVVLYGCETWSLT